MNDALRELVLRADPPKEVLDTLWFTIFCQRFAHELLRDIEQDLENYEDQ